MEPTVRRSIFDTETTVTTITNTNFSPTARPFVLQTDACAQGIGAVLEQGGQVVAYANHVLTHEKQRDPTVLSNKNAWL